MKSALFVAAILAGSVAFAFVRSQPADKTQVKPAAESCSDCCDHCSEGACFAPGACGDEAVVCPAGPDCFAPEVCFDRDVVCPADDAGVPLTPAQ